MLGSVAIDPSLNIELRNQALVSLGLVTLPTSESTATLWQVFHSNHSAAGQAEIRATALLMLGAHGRSLSVNDGLRSVEIFSGLEALTSDMQSMNDRFLLREAISNTGRPELVDRARRALDVGSLEERVDGLGGLRLVASPEADQMLSEYVSNTNVALRRAAMQTLQQRPRSLAATQAIQTQVLQEVDQELRLSMVQYLVQSKGEFPENADILRAVLERESDPEVYRSGVQGVS